MVKENEMEKELAGFDNRSLVISPSNFTRKIHAEVRLLSQWLTTYGLQTNNISITWELTRYANCPLKQNTGVQKFVFTCPLGDSEYTKA